MAYYLTMGTVGTVATNTYTALSTTADGGSTTNFSVPLDTSRVSRLGFNLTISGAQILNTGNCAFVKLSGAALVDGDQEFCLGGTTSDETGTSVTGELTNIPATWQPVNVRLKPGNTFSVSGSYNGTDS